MKLCFISPGYWSIDVLNGDTSRSGGSEAQIAQLAYQFGRLGHKVELYFGGEGDPRSPILIKGIRCFDVFPTWKHPGRLVQFWNALRNSDPDLIYARLPNDFLWIIGIFSKFHHKSKFVYAIGSDRHCNPWKSHGHKPWIHNLLFAIGLRLSDVVVVQHQEQSKLVKPYLSGKCILVPNLIQSSGSTIRDYDRTDIDVIWISQIRPPKQLEILLDIAERLPELKFTVIGSFYDLHSQSIFESKMQNIRNLRYTGPLDHESTMKLLSNSRVLVNTSLWEGFPNTMLEAWSFGVPVVSLQIDPGSVIRHEKLGLVSGTVVQMVNDIRSLVRNGQLNNEMGKRGQNYIKRMHSIEAVCRAFEQVAPGFECKYNSSQEKTV